MPQLVEVPGLTKAEADERAANFSIDAVQVDIVSSADGTFTVRAIYPDDVDVPGAEPIAADAADPAAADAVQGAPRWYTLAAQEIGKAEIGNTNDGPVIAHYRQLAQCGSPGDPWCAIFANAMFALCANPPVPGTKSALARSFTGSSNFVKLGGPALGAVVVFWRKSPNSGKGHVGFYRGETAQSIYVLGGNEDNMVQIEPMSKRQLLGYWWPASATLPAVAPIAVAPGTPHQTKVT